MRILIEEYQYPVPAVKEVLHGIDLLTDLKGKVATNYVGYYYNPLLKDCVFILPKVLMDEKGNVFGREDCKPEDIVNLGECSLLSRSEKDFIYGFAVWIYRAIDVFKNGKGNDTSIVYYAKTAKAGKGTRRFYNTFLDILLALIRFNRENRNFFFFILKNLHSGYNKINWTRTIAKSSAIVQEGRPIYIDPVNKKRQINFDEELLVIYFSILNYISRAYGFAYQAECNFDLIKGKQFETYLSGLGKTRLLQIKYKYFSDKALELWELCYAFFIEAEQMRVNSEQIEYLLVKDFYIVFEAMIDELLGDRDIPRGLQRQYDGKMIDHMYTYEALTTNNEKKEIYYIGDSKYYKIGHDLSEESRYKQFTYARNVIQWSMNLFLGDNSAEDRKADLDKYKEIAKLRDEVTEGYNIIPNFFLSAKIDMKEDKFDYSFDGIEKTDRRTDEHRQRQFKNRLFDRDTLLVYHYDVNFLYVLSLYARNNAGQKAAWKQKIRAKFREDIQGWLQKHYDFYAMKALPDVDGREYIRTHFQELLGKIYSPYDYDDVYSLALDKEYEKENEELRDKLQECFRVKECRLGQDPKELFPELETANSPQAQ